MENTFEMWATVKEQQWKEDWGNDQIIGPLIYQKDVMPYRLLARFVHLKAEQLV